MRRLSTVIPRSPAARAGLRTGHLVAELDGQPVEDPNAFDYRFATKPLSGQAHLTVFRGGREVKLGISLEAAPETPREETEIRARSPLRGAIVANLSPALAEELRLDYSSEDVVVIEVEDGSVAEGFGFRKGDIVVSINNAKIALIPDLLRAISQPVRLWRLTILRNGKEISAAFGG
jgi:S1-C subfamily serine protease